MGGAVPWHPVVSWEAVSRGQFVPIVYHRPKAWSYSERTLCEFILNRAFDFVPARRLFRRWRMFKRRPRLYRNSWAT